MILFAFSLFLLYRYALSGDICFLPHLDHEIGVCGEPQKRFFFNHVTKRCEGFVYKGCGHNENFFNDLRQCRERCEDRQCKLAVDIGGFCSSRPMYYYNLAERSCQLFTYGGCGGNSNRFPTYERCVAVCGHVGFY